MLTRTSSDEELIEDDYEDEMESEEISDVDNDDLMKRLEAKYGKISEQNSDQEQEPEDEDPDASWTSNYTILTTFFLL